MDLSQPPGADEYAEFHVTYVSKVPPGNLRSTIERSASEIERFYRAIPESAADHAYAPGKWTIREVVGHVADSERVFAYRALRFGRGDTTPLSGFDQEVLVPNSNVRERSWSALLDDLFAVRGATLHLFR